MEDKHKRRLSDVSVIIAAFQIAIGVGLTIYAPHGSWSQAGFGGISAGLFCIILFCLIAECRP